MSLIAVLAWRCRIWLLLSIFIGLRRLIECDALLNASTFQPAIKSMARAVDAARQWQATGAWCSVGTENMRFHSAIVELTDSVRLIRLYRQISAELRLAFDFISTTAKCYTHLTLRRMAPLWRYCRRKTAPPQPRR